MLRVYFLPDWFNLSDPAAEEALYDSESMRRFARIGLGEEAIPDETTILNFRHLLEDHRLTEAIHRNGWSACSETGGQLGPKRLVRFERNAHYGALALVIYIACEDRF